MQHSLSTLCLASSVGLVACQGGHAPSSSTSTVRTLEQLLDEDDPGIEVVRAWARDARNPVELLDADPEAGRRALVRLQVTSRSPLGAIALETGGILIDHGWIRVLGSGHPRLARAIDEWNGLGTDGGLRFPGAMLVGDDVLGGFFALDGGGIADGRAHIFYLAPDTLVWEEVATSYSEWLRSVMNGDLAAWYEGHRWTGWLADVRGLPGDRAFSIAPPLWAQGPTVDERSRRAVPLDELWDLHLRVWPQQLGR